ncbi:hypothetical protein [Streptomyces jumonjinensis]|uniref:hypothetical protein n=1 Tax=Streptomyces jumonjinensis TaxID=1945 RepID=UPI0037AF3683
MGIESDQLVYDYLSRVGDLAQRRQLSSGTRMELVSALRGEIDRQRAKAVLDNPASVRRILGRLGTPDDVVTAATGGVVPGAASSAGPAAGWEDRPSAPPPDEPRGSRSSQLSRPSRQPRSSRSSRADVPEQRVRRRIPRPRKTAPAEPPPPPPGALPPHLAGLDELGPSDRDGVDWWSVTPQPFGPGERVAGFTGGVEIPEILSPPPRNDGPAEPEAGEAEGAEELGEAEKAPEGRRPRFRLPLPLPLPRRGKAGKAGKAAAPGAAPAIGHPFLLLAAVSLLAGALFGSWIALGLGWLIAYGSRKLTPAERKLAVFGLPGAALATTLVWLWGRANDRWGAPVPEEGMGEVMGAAWPWALKGAAIASALYLVWRSRRR